MRHSFLLEPGHWQVRGTLFDAVGNGCPVGGDMHITHSAERWRSEADITLEKETPVTISDSYEIVPLGARESATSWRSFNSTVGGLRGHIAVVGEVMISGFSSADHRHSGASYLRQISRDCYHTRGFLISDGVPASSWSVELLRVSG